MSKKTISNAFEASPDRFKFPKLQHFTLNDFEFSDWTYADVFNTFPGITNFSTWYSSRTPRILNNLAKLGNDTVWPNLHMLTFLLDLAGIWMMVN
jgi:hypothetical protein